jgi:hypothetical protein
MVTITTVGYAISGCTGTPEKKAFDMAKLVFGSAGQVRAKMPENGMFCVAKSKIKRLTLNHDNA